MTTNDPARDNFSDIIDLIGDSHRKSSADIEGNSSPGDQMNLAELDMPDRLTGRSAPQLDETVERLTQHTAIFATGVYIGLISAGLKAIEADKIVGGSLACFTLKHAAEIRKDAHGKEDEARFQALCRAQFQHIPPSELLRAIEPHLLIIKTLSRAIREAKAIASEKRSVVARWFGRLKAFRAMLSPAHRQSQLGLQGLTIVAFSTGIDCMIGWPNFKKYELLLGTATSLHAWARNEPASLSVAQLYCLYRCVRSVNASYASGDGQTVNHLAMLAHHHLDIEAFKRIAHRQLDLVGLLTDPPSSQKELLARAERINQRYGRPVAVFPPESPLMH